jgi:cytochrome P450
MQVEDRFASPQTLGAPLEFFQTLRDEAPAFFSPVLQAYVITRYEDVQKVLQNPTVFSSYPAGASPSAMAAFAPEYHWIYQEKGTYPPLPTLVVTDGADHKRYRGTVDKAFSATAVREMQEGIRALINQLIDVFADRGRVDLYAEFCLKLPSFVMCDVIGLPREAAALLKRGADTSPRLVSAALESEESRRALNGERADMYVYIQRFIEQYRAKPADNLLSRLVHLIPDDGVPLTDRELISLAGTLNVGGNETTTNGLGNMFLRTCGDPALQRRLRESPQDIPRLIEETLRIESAVAAMPRWVKADTEIAGTAIPAGSRVFVSFLSANHDERRFACPHVVDLDRSGLRNHLAFGAGPHHCLGASLARLEMKLAVEVILARLEDIRLDPEVPVRRQGKMIVRGVENLPILFKRASA